MVQMGYWAKLINASDGRSRLMVGSTSPENAAGMFAQQLIEESEGAWTSGAIRVWGGHDTEDDAAIFDIAARFTQSLDDEDEIDCEVEIIERDLG